MASPYQQQALRRKLVYIGLIVVLFTVSGVFRAYVVEARAEELALREQNLGEVELGSSALQLSLTGSRGFVVCALWYWAQDAQKKNRWNELDLYTESLTRLQPHFVSPWLFQSWNLSYNVSVEADQVRDKYYYVARGTQLLSKGERMNHFHPDLRFNIGLTQQHKIMQSDETNVYRCLYQMSCIPYPERDPARFRTEVDGHPTINLVVFEEFCVKHPQLVRRLHDRLKYSQPADVVRFLDDNKHIPSLFVDDPDKAGVEWLQGRTPLKDVPDRFPILPPPRDVRQREVALAELLYDPNREELSYDSQLDDAFDAYAAARAWYGYSQEALPAPHPELPGQSAPIVDRTKQRLPKMTTNLFRNHPPRAQSYVAERLAEEGWFGPEGWVITGWFPRDRFHDGREARVGADRNWGEDAWRRAHEMWKLRGERSLMYLEPQRYAELYARALAYMQPREGKVGSPPPSAEPAKGTPEHEGWEAARFLYEYEYSTRLTNFKYFYYRSLAEMEPEKDGQALIAARRTMFEARQNVRQGRRDRAAELFELKTGLERLRLVLERYPEFRQDTNNQEDFYELQLRYVKLMQDKEGGSYKQRMAVGQLLGAALASAPPWPVLTDLAMTERSLTSDLPVPELVPPDRMRVDVNDKDGKPLIEPTIIAQVKVRHGLMKAGPMVAPNMPGGPQGMQGAPLSATAPPN